MKNYLVIIIALLIASCSSNTNPKLDLAEKRIKQSITLDGMGMIPNLEVISVTELDSINFEATHTFSNPMFNNTEVKITRIYTFNTPLLDKILSKKQVGSMLMKVEGEWVESGF